MGALIQFPPHDSERGSLNQGSTVASPEACARPAICPSVQVCVVFLRHKASSPGGFVNQNVFLKNVEPICPNCRQRRVSWCEDRSLILADALLQLQSSLLKGQESNSSQSCDLCDPHHNCGNAGPLTCCTSRASTGASTKTSQIIN